MQTTIKEPKAPKGKAQRDGVKKAPDSTTKHLLSDKELRLKALAGTVSPNDTTKSGKKAYMTQTVDLSSKEVVRSSVVVSKPKFSIFDALAAKQSGNWVHKGRQVRAFTVKASGEYLIKCDGKTVSLDELRAM